MRVRRLRRLVNQKSARENERVFVAEGTKVLKEALLAGVSFDGLYYSKAALSSKSARDVIEHASSNGVRSYLLADGVIEHVASTSTPQPVLATIAYFDTERLELNGDGHVVVLVAVRDPGNVGSIIRSAHASGASAVVSLAGTGDLYNPKAVRASAGSLFHLPVVVLGSVDVAFARLHERGFRILGTRAEDGGDYLEANYEGRVALVLGNEAAGLSDDVIANVDETVSITMPGSTESLNVAMAASVILFELVRQKRTTLDDRPNIGRP